MAETAKIEEPIKIEELSGDPFSDTQKDFEEAVDDLSVQPIEPLNNDQLEPLNDEPTEEQLNENLFEADRLKDLSASKSSLEIPINNDVENNNAATELIMDIPVEISVLMGSANLSVSRLMGLNSGEIIALDRRVGEPLDIIVNGKKIANGEVTMMESDTSKFGIKITKLLDR